MAAVAIDADGGADVSAVKHPDVGAIPSDFKFLLVAGAASLIGKQRHLPVV